MNMQNINNEEGRQMSKGKTGDVLSCEVCGLTVIVDEECGCAAVGVICCEEPMINKGPAAPKKIASIRKAKSATKKKPTKKKFAKKPAAKKKATKKRR
jgi:hypothetical protein